MRFPFLATAICSLVLNFLQAQGVPQSMRRLPDTGQTQDFTTTFGEDSDIHFNTPFFQANGDGTVTDTITGLMWQQTDGGEMTIENAESYCANLALAGYSDWRLPTAQESFSILHHGKPNPALDPVFPATSAEYWWTSEKQVGNANKIWVTNAGGGIGNHLKTETISAGGSKKFHVRAVRQHLPPVIWPEPCTASSSTIIDHLTGLEWQKLPLEDSLSWENALTYANNLELDGKTDWRLPNIKELESINDETRSMPSLNTNCFPAQPSRVYWSSTSLPNQPAKAWYMDTRFGVVTYDVKTARHYLVCVRGGYGTGLSTNIWTLVNTEPVIYPNPAIRQINISGMEALQQIDLYDINGRLVYRQNTAETTLLLPALSPGLYRVCLNTPEGIYYKTLIINP